MTPATGKSTTLFLGAIHVAGYSHRHSPGPRPRQISTPRLRLRQERHKGFDQPLPQLESESAALFDDLQTHGTVLVVVDQPNTIGALAIAVAHQRGCQVGH